MQTDFMMKISVKGTFPNVNVISGIHIVGRKCVQDHGRKVTSHRKGDRTHVI